MNWHDCFTVWDTETTGFGSADRIIEIGVAHFYEGKVVREWSRLIHPNGVEWESENVKKAMAVNQLTLEELVGNPLFEEIRLELLQELSEQIWCLHNSSFDIRMLRQELKRLGETLEHQPDVVCDTMSLDLVVGHPDASLPRKLADVAGRWGVIPDGAHRAVADARVCGQILWAMAQAGKLPTDLQELANLQDRANRAWEERNKRFRRAV
jgi:DNA polymerase-3 subunit epsilon